VVHQSSHTIHQAHCELNVQSKRVRCTVCTQVWNDWICNDNMCSDCTEGYQTLAFTSAVPSPTAVGECVEVNGYVADWGWQAGVEFQMALRFSSVSHNSSNRVGILCIPATARHTPSVASRRMQHLASARVQPCHRCSCPIVGQNVRRHTPWPPLLTDSCRLDGIRQVTDTSTTTLAEVLPAPAATCVAADVPGGYLKGEKCEAWCNGFTCDIS
jgi:hypothetical protein